MDKTQLVNTVKERLAAKAETLKGLISQTQESNSETKSSMGDKYETSREMIAQEIRNLQRQLSEVHNQMDALVKLNSAPSKSVELGALVETGAGIFYISAPVGQLEVDGKKIMTLSPEAPLVKAMQGCRSGDTFSLNNSTQKVVGID
ncbi:hypothetical protein H1R16_02210 [Marnyiella aurantia]|uniref:GreA/GreB family elongation factor n=1 Tax=Marnyiella aurantia TaxID=2758037 RepID=A0A7D7QT54_9FLAO|nr:hypothetical protein [Marnyiella aurantia]MBA5245748.1 hypothetical protein [Marnyiella aurantia]QMS98848.1 hypothetical protein H1R16_02210 [Marnyiella aurantia]